ncbi:MAG: cyclic nucleotide-binding domain-containing protein [Xanthomonadales bacterium]|nr:cyclic nucleotide-binding domain-containing protein [Xanthomonadales bacterium]MBP6690960.1 cyclic nucleotide-binding domain-containing protein [Xanthomonadales bacterium]MBP7417382.1 cyclic nucleotide-binding domain-containing protein [Xanthomonadales bacterium]HQX24099.1 cyclic nucleotide-binding domain-containing protein [Pseudomonadota bacterium]
MAERFKIAIVGSGPGGKSAAAHAAELNVPHVLLEASPYLSYTIYRYQKGKHVMDEPGILPLRSPLPFKAGSRESILDAWNEGVQKLGTNVRFGHEVEKIQKGAGGFTLTCANGTSVEAEFVVLGIGLQGNIRKLGVPGEDLPFVQYQLDDPDEYEGETIVVVGAGDAAIENAIALAKQNQVIIINRKDEFARAKKGNEQGILKAIEDGRVECYYNAAPERVDALPQGSRKKGRMLLATKDGKAQILLDRVIGRLGATAPRQVVESWGVVFPNKDPAAVPAISPQYESNVKGLYIVGALGGYPLIKQAMNQGYEVIEYILGRSVEPADEPLLRDKFAAMPGFRSVTAALERIQGNVKVLSHITPLQLREFMLDSTIQVPQPGEVLFQRNDYTNTFYTIVDGEVFVQLDGNRQVGLRRGEFFGEMSLISGRRRSATVVAGNNCVLIETPRRSMIRLIASVEAVKRDIDRVFIARAIQTRFAPEASYEQIADVVESATIQRYKAGDVVFNEGEAGDCLHLVRVGSLTISRTIGGKEVVLSYVPAGNYVGEMALLGEGKRTATAKAAIATETVRLDGAAFKKLVQRNPVLRLRLQAEYRQRTAANLQMQAMPSGGDIITFLIGQGAGEATDILLIDEALCVRCDNCEKACAETHGGTSRLRREAGPTFDNVHVPTSCRHCEHPHCMKDCPPDAIHRAPNGEVFIADNCIGCGNCERNCPYGVIKLTSKPKKKPGLLAWLMFGAGPGPGEAPYKKKSKDGPQEEKKAVKCDMCKDLPGGAACVRACPTGAAIRISPEEFPQYAQSRR